MYAVYADIISSYLTQMFAEDILYSLYKHTSTLNYINFAFSVKTDIYVFMDTIFASKLPSVKVGSLSKL